MKRIRNSTVAKNRKRKIAAKHALHAARFTYSYQWFPSDNPLRDYLYAGLPGDRALFRSWLTDAPSWT